ncbi:putative polyamine transporter isoform A [Chlorella sorokiniana]|uniref:Polyamine transporter isoform A n=1 Tax=Chlorella sorokiniana TaxID=3076 RepID=A0A2P6TDA7_CHLSO|nr:putative polyamine transporter isoform A [Chlorella sorokiniana]|eukprot:PRW20630.1 putative polyamine transporter isoform A [Chlorella sorokiniana]
MVPLPVQSARRPSTEEPILTRTVSNLSNSSEIELSDGPSLAEAFEGGSPRSSHGTTPRFGSTSRQPGVETIAEGEERPGSTGSTTPQRRRRSGSQAGSPSQGGGQKAKPLSLLPLIALIFYDVSGGPFGIEDAVSKGAPLLALLGFLLLPLIWSVPEALVTAELATTFPENSGYVAWVTAAFGPFWGFQKGFYAWVSGVTDNAVYPVLFLDYLQQVYPVFQSGWPRMVFLIGFNAALTYLNYRGLHVVGDAAIGMTVFTLLPFVVICLLGLPHVKPANWVRVDWGTVQWLPFLEVMFWNLNYWDSVSTLAGEVQDPSRTFPRALAGAVVLVVATYLLPLLVGLGVTQDPSAWELGFFTTLGKQVGGAWLAWWVVAAAAVSQVGQFEAEMSSDSYQLQGMSERGFLPSVFNHRSKYGTPTWGILASSIGVAGIVFLDFGQIVELLNSVYCLGQLLEFVAFIWLRIRYPTLHRPYRIPLPTWGCIAMLTPACLLLVGLLIVPWATGNMPVILFTFGTMGLGALLYPAIQAARRRRLVAFAGTTVTEFKEMLYTMYVPADEETPAGPFVGGSSPKGSDGAEERQGLLVADGSLAAPYLQAIMAHITAVRLKAFKSVGGGWQEFRFDRGLNAIVGPNGCGKSSLLDALCFAFAAPPRTFAAASLADLANSDSSEVCEVAVSLRSGGGEVHTVAAALAPDGGRAFKVNGRVKSGKEVRDFLRGLGISLESGAAVIKQAQVTRLADANSPTDLAALVAEASGLGRWNEEVAAAAEELKRTRRALADVQASLLTLERGVAASEEQLKAAERHEQLEHEAASLAQQLAEALQAAVGAAAAAADEGAAAAEAANFKAQAAQQALEDAQAALAAAQSEAAAAEQQPGGSAGSDATLLSLQQHLAAAEEEVRLLAARQQRWAELQAAVQQEQAAVARLTTAHNRAAAEAAAASQAQRQLEADLRLAESAASAQSLAKAVAAEVQQLGAAVAEGEQAAAAAAAAVSSSEARLAELQPERSRAAEALQAAQAAASGAPSGQAAEALVQQQQAKLSQLRRRESQLAQEAGTLAVRLGGSAGDGWRPLHACFSFADPAAAKQHTAALQVLDDGKLAVAVADSMEAAGQLLAAGSGQRIWPLDSLVAADHTQQQRRAAQAFPAGQVVLPLDLLRFEPRFRPAMLRAFGSHVLAASDAVAGQLITRFGVPSITPDGRVTSHGTLQGGWRGSGSGSSDASPVQLKLRLSDAEAQLAALRQEAAAAEAALAMAVQQSHTAQEAAAALETAAAELAAAEAELQECNTQLAAQHMAAADAQAVLGRVRVELAAKQQLQSSLDSGSSRGAGNEAALAALQREQHRMASNAASLETAAAAVAAELAAAADRLAGAEDALALAAMPADWEAQLALQRAQAAAAAAALAACEAELATASEAAAAKQQAVEAAAAGVAAAKQALAEADGHASDLQAAAARLAAERSELEGQLAALLREVPELRLAPLSATAPAGSQSVAALRSSASQLARQRQRVLEEQRSSNATRLPLAEQIHLREQQVALAAARQQAATLSTAAQRLQEGIDSSNPQVLAANEAVFGAVADTFASLTAAVLPAYRVRMRKVGSAVHEGVRLEFAHHGSHTAAADGADSELAPTDDGSGGGSASWRSGLDVLSGGQRTMVSLAFVVAVAMAGASTSLFLMDEVDAALDEINQHLVARLFDSLSASSAVACSQVLCVSHNAAFQQLCSRVVRLTRGAGGTMPADGGGGKGDGGKAGAAAGRSKKARNA